MLAAFTRKCLCVGTLLSIVLKGAQAHSPELKLPLHLCHQPLAYLLDIVLQPLLL